MTNHQPPLATTTLNKDEEEEINNIKETRHENKGVPQEKLKRKKCGSPAATGQQCRQRRKKTKLKGWRESGEGEGEGEGEWGWKIRGFFSLSPWFFSPRIEKRIFNCNPKLKFLTFNFLIFTN